MMKYLFYVLIVSFVSVSCGNETKENVKQANSKTIEADRIEIIYFYGAKRCITCQAIEANTKKLLDSLYSKEITLGKIVYKTIDLSQEENDSIADKYEITWSSLFINHWKGGRETVNNMTEFSFANAKSNPGKFKDGLKKRIDELLK